MVQALQQSSVGSSTGAPHLPISRWKRVPPRLSRRSSGRKVVVASAGQEPQDSLPPRPQVPAWVLRVAAGAALLLPLAGSHLALTPGAAQAARRRAAPPPPPPVETVSSEAASTPTAAVRQWLRDADLRRGELYSRYQTYMAPASGSRAGNHRAGMPSPLSDPATARVATAVVVVAVALAALRMLSRRQPSGEGAGANGAQGAGADAGVQGTRVAPAAASPSSAPVDVRAPRAASRAAAAAVRPAPAAPAPAASLAPTVPPPAAAESVPDQTVQQQQAQQEQWRQQEQEWWRQQQREEEAAREEGDRAALAAAAQERIDRAKEAMGRAQQAQQELAAAMGEQGKAAEAADLADSAQRALQEAQRSMGEEADDSASAAAGQPPASQQRPSGGALRGAGGDDSSVSSGASRPGPGPAVPVQYPEGVPARPSGGALRGAGAGGSGSGSLQPAATTGESSATGATTRGVGTGSGRAAPAPAGPAAPAQRAPAGEVGRGGGSSRSGPLPGGVPAAAPTPATPASQKPAMAPVTSASSSQASQSKGPADASSSTKGPGEKQAGVAEYLASGGARAPAVAVLGAFAAAKDALAPLLQPGKPASEAPNKPAPQPEAKLAPPPPPATQQGPPPPPQQAGGGWRQEVSRGSVVEPAERLWERQYQAQKAAAAGKQQPAAPGIAAPEARQAEQVGAGTAGEPQETLPPKEQSPPQQPAAATEEDGGSAVLSELESAVQEHWQQQEEQLQASSAVAEPDRVQPPGAAAAEGAPAPASGEPEASQEQQQQEAKEKEEQLKHQADREQRQQEETVVAQSEAADAAQRAQQEPSQQAQQGQEPQPGPEGSTPGTTPTEGEPNGAFGGLLTKLRASVDEHWQQQEQQLQPGLPASSSDPAVVARALQRAAEPEQGREASAAVQPPQQGEPQQAQQEQLLRLVAAGTSIPHPAKAESGGEDAFFVSGKGLGAVGVADGVGGWALEGINPALYPRQLLEQCEEGLAQHEEPLPVLLHAHDRAHAPGSCTVCLATFQAGALLKLVSLGDCSARVIRQGAGIVFKAETQEHQFNMPFQMASLKFLPGSDHPDQARQYEVAVQDGDVVVLGSDGLFDNLWEDDLVALVQARLEDLAAAPDAAALHAATQQLAEQLALQAHSLAQDPTYVSPFAVERHERATSPFVRALSKPAGGKLDDVTVVVGVVSALSAPASGDESPGAGPGEAEAVKAPAAAGV